MSIQLHTFKVDVTPPVGHYICGGLGKPAESIESPLYLRGWIIHANGTRYVTAAIDYCYLIGRSHRRFEDALAQAAQVRAEHVTLQSTHAHSAPMLNEEVHAILAEHMPATQAHDEAYFADALQRSGDAVRDVLNTEPTIIDHVGFASHMVDQFASTRRVLDEDGQAHPRYSICRDPELRGKPVGRIDPLLDAIVLYDQDRRPVTCAGFYACHPQVAARRPVIGGDSVGVAMDLFESRYPDVFPLFFVGCAGDITAGKYTTDHFDRNLHIFGVRLFDGLEGAYQAAYPQSVQSATWRSETFDLPLRAIEEDQAHYEAMAGDPHQRQYLASAKLHRLRNNIHAYPFRTTLLQLNGIGALFLPTELCVDYQLFAKQQYAGPLAVAAYGDSFFNYLATGEAFDQGGYEVMPIWTEVDATAERPIKQAISRMFE
jgi:hypothetical protein